MVKKSENVNPSDPHNPQLLVMVPIRGNLHGASTRKPLRNLRENTLIMSTESEFCSALVFESRAKTAESGTHPPRYARMVLTTIGFSTVVSLQTCSILGMLVLESLSEHISTSSDAFKALFHVMT